MHSFEVHSNESACRKSGRLGLEQVININITILLLFFIFRRARIILSSLNSIRIRSFLSLFAHIVVWLLISNTSYYIASLTCPIVLLACPIVLLTPNLKKLVRILMCVSILIRLVIFFIRKK